MIALYILAGLLLLLLLPVTARFFFDGESRFTVRYAGIPVYRFDSENAKKKTENAKPSLKVKKGKKKGKSKDKEGPLKRITAQLKEQGIAGVFEYIRQLIGVLGRGAGRFLRAVRFSRFRVEMAVATADAAKTAVRYGEYCSVLHPLRAELIARLRVREVAFDLRPDFLRERDAVLADVKMGTCLLRLLWAALCTLVSYLAMTIRLSGKDVENG